MCSMRTLYARIPCVRVRVRVRVGLGLWLGFGLPRMQSAPGRLDALALEYILIDLRQEGEI